MWFGNGETAGVLKFFHSFTSTVYLISVLGYTLLSSVASSFPLFFSFCRIPESQGRVLVAPVTWFDELDSATEIFCSGFGFSTAVGSPSVF